MDSSQKLSHSKSSMTIVASRAGMGLKKQVWVSNEFQLWIGLRLGPRKRLPEIGAKA